CSAATSALRDVQNNARRGTTPLIRKTAALLRGELGDQWLGHDRQGACMLPNFELFEVSHEQRCRIACRHPAPNPCSKELFPASCLSQLKAASQLRRLRNFSSGSKLRA